MRYIYLISLTQNIYLKQKIKRQEKILHRFTRQKSKNKNDNISLGRDSNLITSTLKAKYF